MFGNKNEESVVEQAFENDETVFQKSALKIRQLLQLTNSVQNRDYLDPIFLIMLK